MKDILRNIAENHGDEILDYRPLTGGDINEVFALFCRENTYVVKLNNASRYPGMFEAEAKGLELLTASHSFRIPKIYGFSEIKDTSYLMMEHIETDSSSNADWDEFAENLMKLHQTSNTNFGLDHDNYIGSLPQYNNSETSASDFYINQRLRPQFEIARDLGFKFSDLETKLRNISEEIPNEPASLIHGDLWNGNFMITKTGETVLIDPAVAYAPREMDIGMMHLFGGFPHSLFQHYNQLYPMENGWERRIPIWQLYYLLVHLNLFGSGYLSQVSSIINKYS